jgi:hypothetical protein
VRSLIVGNDARKTKRTAKNIYQNDAAHLVEDWVFVSKPQHQQRQQNANKDD